MLTLLNWEDLPMTEDDDLLGSTSLPGTSDDADVLLGPTSMPGAAAQASEIAEIGSSILEIGLTLDDRYLITRKLGEGGMGTVYLAMDKDTEQSVALKTISPHLSGNPEVWKTLKKEVGTARKLPPHPHLLRVLDIHLRSKPAFITMEAVMGGDLEEYWLAQSRKLEPEDAKRLILQVLSGLQALHDARVVHQDIKPQNILLTPDGSVRITDYGISLSLREQLALGGHDGSGTVLYMSPEQCRGDICDRRADLYSVGMMAYQLLTGGFPFTARTQEELKEWHCGGKRVFEDLPAGFADVVPRLLAIDPNDRPASAKAVIAALQGDDSGTVDGSKSSPRTVRAAAPQRMKSSAAQQSPEVHAPKSAPKRRSGLALVLLFGCGGLLLAGVRLLPPVGLFIASPETGDPQLNVWAGREVDRRGLEVMTCKQLWELRNSVYARHGYAFSTQRAHQHFGGHHRYTRHENVNSETIDSYLSAVDRTNRDAVAAIEAAKNCR